MNFRATRSRRPHANLLPAPAYEEERACATGLTMSARAARSNASWRSSKSSAGRLLPHRVGHRALLPGERYPGTGPRFGRHSASAIPPHHRRRPCRMDLLSSASSRRARRMPTSISISPAATTRARHPVRYQRFGKLGAAMTANVITYRGRSAAREVGKALGFEITTLERLSSWSARGNGRTPRIPASANSARPAST